MICFTHIRNVLSALSPCFSYIPLLRISLCLLHRNIEMQISMKKLVEEGASKSIEKKWRLIEVQSVKMHTFFNVHFSVLMQLISLRLTAKADLH